MTPVVLGLRAVLFDMDGTLIDSEKLWTIALERVSRTLGGEMSAGARAAMVGQDIHDSVRMLVADLRVAAGHDETVALLLHTTAQVFAEGVPWQPGGEALLVAVRDAGLATALVTATPRSLVEIALNTLGRNRFDVEVCGDEVVRSKPDPAPYLRAMDLLGVSAAEAIAIEDSPTGTRSAAGAGVPVLVVPSEVAVPAGPGLVFADSLLDVDLDLLRAIHRTAMPVAG